MYNVNDTVMYSSYGVCRIEEITERDFSGEMIEYYVIRPVGDNKNTFYIPTNNEKLTGQIRTILSEEEINELIKIMPDENFNWIEDEYQRKLEYRRIIEDGDRQELIQLIKALYIHQQNQRANKKKLHSSDEHFLRDAETMLYDEFAYVLNISREQVLPFIQSNITLDEKEI